jgi:hypothetical protein
MIWSGRREIGLNRGHGRLLRWTRSRRLRIRLVRGGRSLRTCWRVPRLRRCLVPVEFVSDRGQQALPQVLRDDEPLNPDRRPGWNGRSGNTAGKRRTASVICHAGTPRGARARANACLDSGTHIGRSIQPESQFVMGKLPNVPDHPRGCNE